MKMKMMLVFAVSSAISYGPVAHADDSKPRVAALFTQTVSQGSWDMAGYSAFKSMATKDGFAPSYLENTTYESAPAVLRQLASDGVKLVIAHSSGYSAAIKEVAPAFPGTQFVLYSYESTTANLPNYSAWSVDWDEYGFVLGVLAASASKSGHIAVISGEPIPSAERTVQFIKKGAAYVNPKIQVDSAYVGSFTDVARAKEIATGTIARGADFIIPAADTADAGIQQAADDEGVLTIGSYTDQSKSFPNAIMTSTVMNFDKSYADIGKHFADHQLGNRIITENLATNGWSLKTPFAHVGKDVETKVFKVIDDLKAGKIKIEE